MKVSTAVARVWAPIELVSSTPKTRADYLLADTLLKKYQRKFGNRHFNQYLRTCIKNGLWETEGKE
jgi:hypothetical protein